MSKSHKVGDSIDLNGKPGYMRLPDGTVVTAAASYEFRHAGAHVLVVDGEEKTYEVADPNAKAKDEKPAGNASREAWAAYAVDVRGATPPDLVDGDGNDLSRDDLKAKYGS